MRIKNIALYPLYHATDTLKSVLDENVLRAKTSHVLNNKNLYGVSTTREYSYAKRYANIMMHESSVYNNVVGIIILDRDLLKNNYKILPVDYFSDDEMRRRGVYAEAEEFVVGDIKPLSKYMKGFLLGSRCDVLEAHPMFIGGFMV